MTRSGTATKAAWPLFNRRFRLLYAANLTSMVGTTFSLVGLTFAVLDLGGSASDLGHVLLATMLPRLALLLIGGAAADRWSRTAVMIVSSLTCAFAQIVVVALLFTDAAKLWHLIVLAAVTGAANGFFAPALRGVLPLLMPLDRLRQATVQLRIADSGSLVVGPAIAGVLISATSQPALALFIDALSFLVAVPLLLLVGLTAPARTTATLVDQLREGWRVFWSRSWLWTVVIEFSFLNLGESTGFRLLGPLQADDRYGGAAGWGLLISAKGAGFLLGGVVSWWVKPRRLLLTGVCCAAGCALPIAAMAAGLPFPVVVAVALVAGALLEQHSVAWVATMQHHLPPAVLSRVSAYDILGSDLLIPLGFLTGGAVAATVGTSTTQWLCVALIVIPTLLVLINPNVRVIRRPDERGESSEEVG